MSVRLSGVFAIEMEISDGAAKVTSIPRTGSTLTYKHVVRVENISKHPMFCTIKAALPNRAPLLEFVGSSLGPTEWTSETIYSIPCAATRKLDCEIQPAGSKTGVREPVDCIEVWARNGIMTWNQLTTNVPFGILVDVT